MFKPGSYAKINGFQRETALESLKQFEDKLKWKDLEGDTLIDIGCGPGDVTFDYVIPALSEKFKKVVASDISPDMLEFVKQKYGSREARLECQVLDIGNENLEITEQFDHLTSFFCLNFPKNQRCCIKNIYNLLKPGGDAVLVLMVSSNFYELYQALMDDPKWSSHLLDMQKVITPYHYMEDPVATFKEYLEEAGFKTNICRLKKEVRTVDLNFLKVCYEVIKFLKPTSQHLLPEFEKDRLDISKRINMLHSTKDEAYIRYGAIVAYIKKD